MNEFLTECLDRPHTPVDNEVLGQVREVLYNFEIRRGRLVMEWGSVPDMSGTIALFERLDPEVEAIQVVELTEEAASRPEIGYTGHDGRRVYFYVRDPGGGEWRYGDPPAV